MSERYQGGFVSLSFNPLGSQTSTYTGSLYGWGYNTDGQLGQNNTANKSSPTQIGSDDSWVKVDAYLAVLGIKYNGTLWSWGINGQGQLGQNDTIPRS